MIRSLRLLAGLLIGLLLPVAALAGGGPIRVTSRPGQPATLPGEVIVKLKPQSGVGKVAAAVEARLGAVGVRQSRPMFPESVAQAQRLGSAALARLEASGVPDLSRVFVLSVDRALDPAALARQIALDPAVEYAEPRFLYKASAGPNDSLYITGRQPWLAQISAPAAWDVTHGDGVIIGIVDSGVDWDHPDLAANIRINPGEIAGNGIDDDGNGYIDDIHGWDFGGATLTPDGQPRPDNNPMEDMPQHGTHVAGLASAVTDNRTGVASVGYHAKLLPVKAANGEILVDGEPAIAYPYEGIKYAVDNGAKVVNASFGGSGRSQLGQDVVTYALSKGALVVAAAGNEQSGNPSFPGAYDGVTSVAAVNRSDGPAYYTNYGPTVDLAAPGGSTDGAILSTWQNDTYAQLQGTSMATPMVSGAAALVFAAHPDWSPAQVAAQLRSTTDDIEARLPTNRKRQLGRGRLNVARAVGAMSEGVLPTAITFDDGAGNNDGTPDAGETLVVGLTLTNVLRPTTALVARLVSTSPSVVVLDGQRTLGALATGQRVVLAGATGFRIAIDPQAPLNLTARLSLELSDGTGFSDYAAIDLLVNPTFRDHNANQIVTTFTNDGNVGFDDFPSNIYGRGFTYRGGPNLLYEGALMIGTGPTQVMDVARSPNDPEGAGEQNQDFVARDKYRLQTPGTVSDQDGLTRFTDEGGGPKRIGLEIIGSSFAFGAPPLDDIVFVRYQIRNATDHALDNLVAGLYFDWDLAPDGGQDVAETDLARGLGYIYDASKTVTTYVGIVALDGMLNHWALTNNPDVFGNPFGVYDDFTTAEKWRGMTDVGGRYSSGGPGDVGNIISHQVGALGPGDTATVGFALMAGDDLADLQRNADAANARWPLLRGAVLTVPTGGGNTTPLAFRLLPAAPNPFNPTTAIRYQLAQVGAVRLDVFDALGRRVRTLVDEAQAAGPHTFVFDGVGLPSGVYFVRLSQGRQVESRRITLIR